MSENESLPRLILKLLVMLATLGTIAFTYGYVSEKLSNEGHTYQQRPTYTTVSRSVGPAIR